MSRTIQAVLIAALIAGCGGSKNPVAPPDPNAGMYGTWTGTVRVVAPTGTSEWDFSVVLTKGNAVYHDGGGQYPTTLTNMTDPNLGFFVTAYGYRLDFAGTRNGDALQGTCGNASLSIAGDWATSRTTAAPALRGGGIMDALKAYAGDR